MKKISIFLIGLLAFTGFLAPSWARHAVKISAVKAVSAVIDINQADANSLTTLKGIGPKKADAIVKYRKAHGKFKSYNDLVAVHGISTKFLARLKEKNVVRIRVGEKIIK